MLINILNFVQCFVYLWFKLCIDGNEVQHIIQSFFKSVYRPLNRVHNVSYYQDLLASSSCYIFIKHFKMSNILLKNLNMSKKDIIASLRYVIISLGYISLIFLKYFSLYFQRFFHSICSSFVTCPPTSQTIIP